MSGIECPACGRTASEVTDTRRAPNKIRRRRKCTCGHRFQTVETVWVAKQSPRISIPTIKKMRDDGCTYEAIAARFGVSLSTVWKRDNGL